MSLLLPATASAHGEVHQRIEDLSARIASQAPDPLLYLRRAELHRQHRDWEAALADCDRAAELSPELDAARLLRSRVLLEAGRASQAKASATDFLARHPDHVVARLTRARALDALGEDADAVLDYTQVIERVARPDPDLYLARAAVLVRAGRTREALAGIDAGLARLGPLASLQHRAIELEVALGHADAALARIDATAAALQRREGWLALRGEILLRFQRADEARVALSAALAEIERLPSPVRATRATAELESRVRTSLARL